MQPQDAAELRELLALAQEATPPARERLAHEVGQLLVRQPEALSEVERGLAADILASLIREVEMPIRRALAVRLARAPRVPRALLTRLANDEIEVARPILLESGLLEDDDLIEIVRQRTMQHRLAIAMRRQVSYAVSAALVEAGEDDVMRTLVENPNAPIARATLDFLVERSKTSSGLQAPLLHRHELEPEIAGRMYGWVSAALKRHIALNFDVDPAYLDRALEESLEEIIADHARAAALGDATTKLAEALAAGRLGDPSLLVRLVRAGEIALFEAAFAKFIRLPITLTRRMIYEPGARPLAVACRTCGFDKATFASLLLLSRQARPGDKSVDPDEIPSALAFFDAMTETKAQNILVRWRGPLYAGKRQVIEPPAASPER
ncbi:MAG: DUF2336 domain-containing protein [Pseudomonadota bacterium]